MIRLLPFLLLCSSVATAQEARQEAIQRRLRVKTITAISANHQGPWNNSARRSDTIIYHKLEWELNRRGDNYLHTSWDGDTIHLASKWERRLYYDDDSDLFHDEMVQLVSAGLPLPAEHRIAPQQESDGFALRTTYFRPNGEVQYFTHTKNSWIIDRRKPLLFHTQQTVLEFGADSNLRQKEFFVRDYKGRIVRSQCWQADARRDERKSPLLESNYAFRWTNSIRNQYDNRGNLLATSEQWADGRKTSQRFRYQYQGDRVVKKEEYDGKAAYLIERYTYYRNGLLRTKTVHEGYQPHLREAVTYRYSFY